MKAQTKERRFRLVEEWQSSGESKADFAARHGIGRSTFYYWTKNMKRQGQEQQPDKGFQTITFESAAGTPTAIIHYPSGARLELHTPIDASFIKSLIS